MINYLGSVFIVVLITGIQCQDCRTNFTCVSFSECTINTDDFIYPCSIGKVNKICCANELTKLEHVSNTTNLDSRNAQFPVNCGIVFNDDRITGGQVANIGQFPWMALLGYKQKVTEFTQFLCGGSLITDNYVLTAAHCLKLPDLELMLVRLGELDMSKNPDCETILGRTFCAGAYVEVLVSEVIIHENFDSVSLKNDIGLVKMQMAITFTDWIQPICLPFDLDLRAKKVNEQKLTVSGWGKTSSENLGGSTTLQYTIVRIWDNEKCNISVPPEVRPIKDQQICANGPKKEDACKGDSGGPLFNTTLDGMNVKVYQLGIVSFASALVCGNAELPTIYTKVDAYLNWIIENVK